MKFSKWEIEFLDDRLSLDAITDTLIDGDETDTLQWDDVEEARENLRQRLLKDKALDIPTLTDLEEDILHDAIVGSTWFAGAHDSVNNDEMTPQQFGKQKSYLRQLGKKLNEGGFEVNIDEVNME